MTANNSPGKTWNETSVRAFTPAKRTDMPSMDSKGVTDADRRGALLFVGRSCISVLSLISPTFVLSGADEECPYYCALHLHAVQGKTCAHSRPVTVGRRAVPARLCRSPAHIHSRQWKEPSAHFALPAARQCRWREFRQ